ncbi:MAG: hypothetical protein Tsb0021_11620 [Chlamydiales bacterium]
MVHFYGTTGNDYAFNGLPKRLKKKPKSQSLGRRITRLTSQTSQKLGQLVNKVKSAFIAAMNQIGAAFTRLKDYSFHVRRPNPSGDAFAMAAKTAGILPNKNDSEVTLESVSTEKIFLLEPKVFGLHGKNPISLEALQESGLLPNRKMAIDNATYYCSPIFDFGGKKAVFALVEVEGKVYQHVFYHSESQGTWRTIPNAMKGIGKEGHKEIRHFGKGDDETSTQLPIQLIIGLNQSIESGGEKNVPVLHDAFNDMLQTIKFDEQKPFESIVEKEEIVKVCEECEDFVPNPQDLILTKDFRPNFQTPEIVQKGKTALYGDVTFKVFLSHNEKVRYLFIEVDKDKRAFLASAEIKNATINHYGVRNRYPGLNHLDSPLIEYREQIKRGYASGSLIQQYHENRNKYGANWNYVRNLTLIQEYYQAQNLEIPEEIGFFMPFSQ